MSFPHTPNLQEEKTESLQTQREYLNILRLRHLQWLSSTLDGDVQAVHLEIAELIEKITDRYQHLLDGLPHEKDTSPPPVTQAHLTPSDPQPSSPKSAP
jgi:hypothetical protein